MAPQVGLEPTSVCNSGSSSPHKVGSFHLVAAPPAHSLHPPPAAVVLGALRPQAARRLVGSMRYVTMPKKNTTLMGGVFFGASSRTRTYDPAVNSRMLYRLSY